MKKAFIWLLLAALLAMCAGCGDKTAEKKTDAPEQNPPASEQAEPAGTEPGTDDPGAGQTDPAPAQPEADETDYLAVYAPVLDEICDVLYNGVDDGGYYAYLPTGLMEIAHYQEPDELLSGIGYRIEDVSGDGVPELLVGTVTDGGAEQRTVVFGGYSYGNGEIVTFLDGWARNSFEWLGDGKFFNQGSNGAMYSSFGVYRVAPDGSALACEDFYFSDVKDADATVAAYYHNTTGVWEKTQAEELDVTGEQFWTIGEQMLARSTHLDMTPFGAYDYTGYVAQPLACKVRADYFADAEDNLDDYEDLSEQIAALYPAGTQFETKVVFYSEEDVRDFTLLSLELQDVDAEGNASFAVTEVFSLPTLRAGMPVVIPMSFPGDIPSNGFSYTDADGTVHRYSIGMSGRDGSLVFSPLD